MPAVTDVLYSRATEMAKTSSFVPVDLLDRLATLTADDADALDFGVIRVDDRGVVELYNRCESEIAGYAPEEQIGRNFFTQVAPCTNNSLFYGSFKKGVAEGGFNLLFPYTFTYKVKPTNVRVHMYRDETSGTNWIFIKKG